MSTDELERYEAELRLALVREYRDVVRMFRYVIETERRTYLANQVTKLQTDSESLVKYKLVDAWVWDMYRQSRFLTSVEMVTSEGISIEKIPEDEL